MNYPIFIYCKDDKAVRLILNEKELSWYEESEIRVDLYQAWDSTGASVDLEFNKKLNRPFVEYSNRSTEVSLKDVLENYAKKYFKVNYLVEGNDFVKFYLRLENEFGKERTYYGKGFLFMGLLIFILCLILYLIGKLTG